MTRPALSFGVSVVISSNDRIASGSNGTLPAEIKRRKPYRRGSGSLTLWSPGTIRWVADGGPVNSPDQQATGHLRSCELSRLAVDIVQFVFSYFCVW